MISLDDLEQFTGTENWYKHWTGLISYTDGVKFLADEAKCHWLIDLVASYQTKPEIRKVPFQLWEIKVKEQTGLVTMQEDTGEPVLVKQELDYTDFPFDEFQWYLIDLVMLLKGEY